MDTLKTGEPHPSAKLAFRWFKEWVNSNPNRYILFREAIASSALSGNRLAEVMVGTLKRIDKGEPVSDRYILGLAWGIKELYREE